MLSLEKLKRALFLFGLDEPFQLSSFIGMFNEYYNIKNEKEKNAKMLEIIKYLIENDLFQIGEDWNFEKWPLSNEETLLKIKVLLDSTESLFMKAFFDFTEKGIKEANEYWNKLNIIREKTLLLCENNYINIKDIIDTVKEVFQTNDPEEIEYEFLTSVSSITDWFFIEPGIIKNHEFQTFGRSQYQHLQKQIKTENEFEINKDIYFRITPKGKLVLDEWKKLGGRISDHFNKIIFSKDEGY